MESTKQTSSTKHEGSFFFARFGLSQDIDYLLENLSMLVAAGMPIVTALESITEEVRSQRMKKILQDMIEDIENGHPIWRALETSGLFPEHAVALIRIGEASGRLGENLKVVAIEEQKRRALAGKVKSALLYPVFVLAVTAVVGVGIAWFILPKLALVFSQLKIELPLITRVLIKSGIFLEQRGIWAVPLGLFLGGAMGYFIFFFSKTRSIGQSILLHTPGIGQLIREGEIARFGYLLGTLLQAGLPVTHALSSLSSATQMTTYRRLYEHLRSSIEDGNSFQKSFALFPKIKRIFPLPLVRLLVAGEQSGSLPDVLIRLGANYESKAETTTKNLTIILEPLLLVLVWLGVVAVAFAVILPIYSLVGGLNGTPAETSTSNTQAVSEEALPVSTPEAQQVSAPEMPAVLSTSEVIVPKQIRILTTGVGYLNVREQASLQSRVIARVKPEEAFPFITFQEGWYEILVEDGVSGWVTEQYVEKIE